MPALVMMMVAMKIETFFPYTNVPYTFLIFNESSGGKSNSAILRIS